ncbi:MAG: hypothetical protein ABSE73_04910 [Planctomycetota bacterium]
MPPTTENIAEKPVFNVYGALLVLSFLACLGAALIMRQELVEHWGWGADKANAEATRRAIHITEINEDPEKYPDTVKITDTDMKEWEIIKGTGTPFPVSNYKWPPDYNPLTNPVKPGVNNLDESVIPEAARNALMKDWNPEAPPPSAEKPAEPAPAEKKEGEAPAEKKEEGKKEEGKPEEKKAEPAPAEKKDEAKPEEKKAEPAPAEKKAEPAPAEKKDEAKPEEKKAEPAPAEKKDEAKKEEPKKDEPKKDEPKKEEEKK